MKLNGYKILNGCLLHEGNIILSNNQINKFSKALNISSKDVLYEIISAMYIAYSIHKLYLSKIMGKNTVYAPDVEASYVMNDVKVTHQKKKLVEVYIDEPGSMFIGDINIQLFVKLDKPLISRNKYTKDLNNHTYGIITVNKHPFDYGNSSKTANVISKKYQNLDFYVSALGFAGDSNSTMYHKMVNPYIDVDIVKKVSEQDMEKIIRDSYKVTLSQVKKLLENVVDPNFVIPSIEDRVVK